MVGANLEFHLHLFLLFILQLSLPLLLHLLLLNLFCYFLFQLFQNIPKGKTRPISNTLFDNSKSIPGLLPIDISFPPFPPIHILLLLHTLLQYKRNYLLIFITIPFKNILKQLYKLVPAIDDRSPLYFIGNSRPMNTLQIYFSNIFVDVLQS